jgi:hypothetical protein
MGIQNIWSKEYAQKNEPLIYIMYRVLVYHFFTFNFVFVHFLGN